MLNKATAKLKGLSNTINQNSIVHINIHTGLEEIRNHPLFAEWLQAEVPTRSLSNKDFK